MKKILITILICMSMITVLSACRKNTSQKEETASTDDVVEITENKQEEKLTFEIIAGETGQYGELFTFNKGTDVEITRCIYHIPAGTYRVTNVGNSVSQVNVYSDEVHKTEEGWEEPAESFECKVLKENESEIISVEDSQNVYFSEPGKLKFEKQ